MNPVLTLAIGAVALLYASVGHAGATGYIAVMTLFGLDPQVIRPTALMLNVIVASIVTAQFWRAGHFRPRLFLPLAAASVPAAAAGGAANLPTAAFEAIVGVVLLFSAVRIVVEPRGEAGDADVDPTGASRFTSLFLIALGGSLGLLSGLTGVGGGVFLTPALLAPAGGARQTSGRRLGPLHPRQLDRRSARWICRRPPAPADRAGGDRGGRGWRRRRVAAGRVSGVAARVAAADGGGVGGCRAQAASEGGAVAWSAARGCSYSLTVGKSFSRT